MKNLHLEKQAEKLYLHIIMFVACGFVFEIFTDIFINLQIFRNEHHLGCSRKLETLY